LRYWRRWRQAFAKLKAVKSSLVDAIALLPQMLKVQLCTKIPVDIKHLTKLGHQKKALTRRFSLTSIAFSHYSEGYVGFPYLVLAEGKDASMPETRLSHMWLMMYSPRNSLIPERLSMCGGVIAAGSYPSL
jgi:hypothetical protein